MRYVFGPVPSRRLGFSLGVDVLPMKVCSYNCIYCQLGRTTRKTMQRDEYVPIDPVVEELNHVLSMGQRIDYITFSGSGEPTLHVKIGEMIRSVKRMTSIPVAVLTNGSLLGMEEVREDLSAADLVIPSMDAVSEEVFRRINRPHGTLDIGEVLEGLKAFHREFRGPIWLEIMLVKGVNDDPEEIERMAQVTAEIGPDRIQLNTVVRPPAEAFARPLTAEEMERIRDHIGEPAEVVAAFQQREQSAYRADVEQAILAMASRRPVTLRDLSSSLGLHPNEVIPYVETLEEAGRVRSVGFGEERYYEAVPCEA